MEGSYDKLTGSWERLLAAVRESEGIIPGVAELEAALEWHLQEVKATKARQMHHVIGRQQATQDLAVRMTNGHDVASRLRSLVKSALGPRDERLAKFGVAPIRSRSRVK